MAVQRLNNYLRTHRKHAGLSQSELSFLVRLRSKSVLSRYERGENQPSLRTALACQAAFGTPVSELFAGFSDSVAKDTRGQMKRLRTQLQAKIDPNNTGNGVMQKFQWISNQLLKAPNFKLIAA